jgi:polyribonucleotide nucleotidyltransferase
MRLVDQETGEELPDTRPPREPRGDREGGGRDRGDRGRHGRGGGDRDRGPRRDRGDRGGRDDRGPRGDRGDRGPRREREGSEGEQHGGEEPKFAPAFLTGDDAD